MNIRRRHRQLTHRTAALAAAALATTAVAACGSAASSARPASSGPITIGMSLPMTGPVADVSKSGYQGYELWAAQVNANGGLLGRTGQARHA